VHAQKGRAELSVTVDGRVAHAAFPHLGESALVGASRLVLECERRTPADDPVLGQSLLVATEATTYPRPGISIVPDRCDLRFDRRLLLGEEQAGVIAEMQELCARAGVAASIAITADPVTTYTGVELEAKRWLPAWCADAGERLRLAAEAAVGGGGHPYLFCTNGSATAPRGIPTVGYGPGDTRMAHQPDEWIAMDQVERAARGYEALAQIGDWRNSA
jgi:acetylornithine deacetylase/succinyl-diaminopimelate desuccinylase-like protein